MHEQGIRQEAQNGLKPVEIKVLNNFFWSFHHSQGNPALQTLIFIYLARQYNKNDIGDINSFETRIRPRVEKLKVPSEHLKENIDETTGKVRVLDEKEAQENEAGFQ